MSFDSLICSNLDNCTEVEIFNSIEELEGAQECHTFRLYQSNKFPDESPEEVESKQNTFLMPITVDHLKRKVLVELHCRTADKLTRVCTMEDDLDDFDVFIQTCDRTMKGNISGNSLHVYNINGIEQANIVIAEASKIWRTSYEITTQQTKVALAKVFRQSADSMAIVFVQPASLDSHLKFWILVLAFKLVFTQYKSVISKPITSLAPLDFHALHRLSQSNEFSISEVGYAFEHGPYSNYFSLNDVNDPSILFLLRLQNKPYQLFFIDCPTLEPLVAVEDLTNYSAKSEVQVINNDNDGWTLVGISYNHYVFFKRDPRCDMYFRQDCSRIVRPLSEPMEYIRSLTGAQIATLTPHNIGGRWTLIVKFHPCVDEVQRVVIFVSVMRVALFLYDVKHPHGAPLKSGKLLCETLMSQGEQEPCVPGSEEVWE